MFYAIFISILLVLATILPSDLVVLLVPVITWLATLFVNWLKKILVGDGFGGSIVVTLIVPIFSLLSAYIIDLIANPDQNFWLLFVFGFVGTWVSEVIKQWKQSLTGSQTNVTKLLG